MVITRFQSIVTHLVCPLHASTGLLALGCLILLFLANPVQAAPNLFASNETSSRDLSPFPKWTQVMQRQASGLASMRQSCGSAGNCSWNRWNQMVQKASTLQGRAMLDYVNSTVNQVRYIEDADNWGISDFWASTDQFFARSGDCEDYAITKYYALKAAGFPARNLRIVVLNDTNKRILHAVLAAYIGNEAYILDNQINRVMSHRSIRHYQPIYSINEWGWWRHTTGTRNLASAR